MFNLVNRRRFVEFITSVGVSTPLLPKIFAAELTSKDNARNGTAFKGLGPVNQDQLMVAPGFRYYLLGEWGDPINKKKDTLGTSCDFLGFLPTSNDKLDGYLIINHEAPDPLLTSLGKSPAEKTKKQVDEERYSVGCSIVRLRYEKSKKRWSFLTSDAQNRRLDANTKIPFALNAEIQGSNVATGTFANCSGGVTPWNTFLTCEENYDEYFGVASGAEALNRKSVKYGWERFYKHPPEHYGWVVEVHPDKPQQQKLTSLGRFAHEGALVVTASDGTPVVYMGDDTENQCLYKFISSSKNSLERGTLYVANLEKKRWIPLSREEHEGLAKTFATNLDIMIHTRKAAQIVGGTPLDRPEGITKNPINSNIMVSLTNNASKGNPFGSLLRITEKNSDHLAKEFEHSTYIAGGPQAGFACPDNICFDKNGGLWMTSDISGKVLNQGVYKDFGNNGLFYIPAQGDQAGIPIKVASAPNGAELTGPCLLPDGETLLFSVQHPGEGSTNPKQPNSHWPKGGKNLPRSAVVALTGKKLKELLG